MNRTYEDELQLLIDKVEQVNDMDWVEVTDELGINMSPETLRKSFTGGYYGGYQVAKYYQDKIANGILTEQEVGAINAAKDELFKEKVRLQDARRELNALKREDARFENLVDRMTQAVEELPDIVLPKAMPFNETGIAEASLLISDLHYGLEVDNAVNFYNCDLVREYLAQICEKTKYYCALHRVHTLHINLAGDLISGRIRLQARVDNEEDTITQIISVSEILSEFIAQLDSVIPEVKVYGVIGNHSRVEENKKSVLHSENFERLIFRYIKLRVPHIPFITNGLEDWLIYKIKDKRIFLTHGDKDSVNNIKIHAVNITQQIPDICYLGHVHHLNVKDDNGTMIVVNGSLVGSDDYAVSLRYNTKPYQMLQIFDKDMCLYQLGVE